MKTTKSLLPIHVTCLLTLIVSRAWSAETIRHVTRNSGVTSFQIQNASPGALYQLKLEDLAQDHSTQEISGFKATDLPDVLSADAAIKKQGVYLIHLIKNSREVKLSETGPQLPEVMGAENAEMDRKSSSVRWRTPRSSLARVNAVLHNGMRIDTIVPWHFTSNQEQFSSWDFRDRAKVKDYREHPNLQVYVQFIPLPDCLVVAGHPPLSDYQQHPYFRSLLLPVGDNPINMQALSKEFRTVPELPGTKVPVVREGAALRVDLDPRTKARIGLNRYEIMFYADGEFIHEESEGADPYTFLLPKLPRASGLLYLSVNLSDYRGNSGVCTIPAWYEPDPE